MHVFTNTKIYNSNTIIIILLFQPHYVGLGNACCGLLRLLQRGMDPIVYLKLPDDRSRAKCMSALIGCYSCDGFHPCTRCTMSAGMLLLLICALKSDKCQEIEL